MIPEIQSYLQQPNPDFNSGFALFCKYSPNRILIESIGRRHDQGMLLYELEKISNSGFYSPIPGPTPVPTVQLIQAQAEKPEAALVPAVKNVEVTVDPSLKKALSFRTYDDRRTSRRDLPPDLQTEYDANSEAYRLRRGFHEKMKLAKGRDAAKQFLIDHPDVRDEIEEKIRESYMPAEDDDDTSSSGAAEAAPEDDSDDDDILGIDV